MKSLKLFSVASIAVCAASAGAQIITQWTFENQPITGAPPYNNSPTPSTGVGTATPLGMTNSYGTPNNSVTSCDILSDPGSSDSSSQQAWRIRGQADPTTNLAANGWSTKAPEFSQGAEFDVSTAGFNKIKVSFDWQPTNRGVEDIELQYNSDISNAAGWTNLGSYHNTVSGGTWNNGNLVDLSSLGAVANDANFGIRIVSAYHAGTTTYYDTTGHPLNNSSGNIRVDNVTIMGQAVPEPCSMIALGAGLAVLVRNRKRLAQ